MRTRIFNKNAVPYTDITFVFISILPERIKNHPATITSQHEVFQHKYDTNRNRPVENHTRIQFCKNVPRMKKIFFLHV